MKTLDEGIDQINMLYENRRVLYNLHCKEHDLFYNLLHVQRQIASMAMLINSVLRSKKDDRY